MTVTPWFLKIPDSAHRGAQNPLPKTILARRTGRLGSVRMIFPPNAPNPATSRPSAEHSSFQRFSFQRFSFSRSPLLPRNPLFPALRSAPTAVSRASRQKQIPSSGRRPRCQARPTCRTSHRKRRGHHEADRSANRGETLSATKALFFHGFMSCAAGEAEALPPSPWRDAGAGVPRRGSERCGQLQPADHARVRGNRFRGR